MTKAYEPSRNLPLIERGKNTTTMTSVVCPHEPICETAEACVRRSMEYAMGFRKTP